MYKYGGPQSISSFSPHCVPPWRPPSAGVAIPKLASALPKRHVGTTRTPTHIHLPLPNHHGPTSTIRRCSRSLSTSCPHRPSPLRRFTKTSPFKTATRRLSILLFLLPAPRRRAHHFQMPQIRATHLRKGVGSARLVVKAGDRARVGLVSTLLRVPPNLLSLVLVQRVKPPPPPRSRRPSQQFIPPWLTFPASTLVLSLRKVRAGRDPTQRMSGTLFAVYMVLRRRPPSRCLLTCRGNGRAGKSSRMWLAVFARSTTGGRGRTGAARQVPFGITSRALTTNSGASWCSSKDSRAGKSWAHRISLHRESAKHSRFPDSMSGW
ncbi:hypothetical protein C8R47DRAFT_1088132 [Mycena vitilis]|nr:hypothetical protein C8R47DRAFT_1088132 [Mycena vitilis]